MGNAKGRLDRTSRRHFVYTLTDAADEPVYVGRSCNVAIRLKSHAAGNVYTPPAWWLPEVRTISMTGPYTWDEAVAVEREEIKRLNPRGNIANTPRALGRNRVSA